MTDKEGERGRISARRAPIPQSAFPRLRRKIGLHGPVRAVAVVGPAGSGLLVRRVQISHHFELAHRLGLSITFNGWRVLGVTPRSARVRAKGGGRWPPPAPRRGGATP